MKIRKANLKDAKACEIIRKKEEKRWSSIDFSSSVRDRHCIFIVAEEDRKVAGYCIGFVVPTQNKEAMLHETRVAMDQRRKGIGKELVDAFCKETFRQGVRAIYSEIEQKHLKFYKNCGFKKNAKWIEVKREPNIMDFAGAWKMSEKEAEVMKKGLRRAWKMRKFKSLD